VVALPAYVFVLPREPQRPTPLSVSPILPTDPPRTPNSQDGALFLLMAATITLSSMISTTLSVHLLTALQAKGLTLAAAVGLGALVGPSQVAARAVEMVIARYHHPVWTKVASTSLVAAGLAALWIGVPIIPLALALDGAGIGLESIARGTLPLAVFGPERYPVVMGRIAMPSLIAQAAAPSIGTALIEGCGFDGALRIFVAAAICNVILAVNLFLLLRRGLSSTLGAPMTMRQVDAARTEPRSDAGLGDS
jgi:hypothetical protein